LAPICFCCICWNCLSSYIGIIWFLFMLISG
jgi:hypothetical protein